MDDKKRPTIDSVKKNSNEIKPLKLGSDITETIDVGNLLIDSQMTSSGSFDLRGVHETSLAKLLSALPVPALLIDRSQTIIFANAACGRPAEHGRKLEAGPLFSIFTRLDDSRKFDVLAERVFAQRKPEVSGATVDLGNGPIWARIHVRSVRVGSERLVLLIFEDLTHERKEILLTKKHERQLLKARNELEKLVRERTADLEKTNERLKEEIAVRKRAEEELRKSQVHLERLVDERTAALRETNARLLEAKNEWERTFDAVPDLVFLIDKEYRIVRANKVLADRLGLTWSQVIGSHCYEIVHRLPNPPAYCPHAKLLADGKEHSTEVFERCLNGTFHVTVSPLCDREGVLIGSVHVARNITARKRMEDALKESEKRYRELVERASDVLYQADIKGHFTLSNPAMSRITGYSDQELIGKHYLDLIHPDYKKSVERFYGLQFVKKIPETDYEFAILTKRGEKVWLTQRVQLLTEGDAVVGFQAICRDITELKQVQIALTESEERYRQLVELSPDGIYVRIDQECVFANRSLAGMLGVDSPDELIGRRVKEFYHPECIEKLNARMRKLQEVDEPLPPAELTLIRTDGGKVDVETMAAAQIYQGQRAFQVVLRDITDRKRAEEALRKSEERYRMLVETMGESLIVFDENGMATFVNSRFCKLAGYSSDELIGRSITDIDFRANLDQKELLKQWEQRRQGLNGKYEAVFKNRDGRQIDAIVSSQPIFDAEGHFKGSFSVVTDITDRKRDEERIKASLQEKEVLLKEIHHRVKNNLQIISSLLQLQSFHVEGKSAEGVVEDLESRIRAIAAVHEKLYQSDNLMRIDVNDYIQDLAEHLVYSYGQGTPGIELIINIQEITCGIDTAVPLGLIISELVSNSLKHGFSDRRAGSIAISLDYIDNDALELVVSDNGVGMPTDLEAVGSETLGLSLVKSLADQLHAEMRLDRAKGPRYTLRFKEVEKRRR